MSTGDKKLSLRQEELKDKIINGKKNIFFTGCAGTGKSFVLNSTIKCLRNENKSLDSVAVTASTGKAAFNIGGSTLHSFAGIGLGKETKEQLFSKIIFNKNAAQRWIDVTVLIIDEVSMIDGELFEKLEYISKRVRRNNKPFGGIQLVLVGDLLQLPPIDNEKEPKKRIFEAECWNQCINEYILLDQVFRQQDILFIRTLTCIRIGCVTEEVQNFINTLESKREFKGDSSPVYLYATKNKTERYNNQKLNDINEQSILYKAKDSYTSLCKSRSKAFDSCQVPSTIEVKKGAQVMLVKNLTKDLVNGTVGTITNFTTSNEKQKDTFGQNIYTESLPIVRFDLADGRTYTRPIKRENWDAVTSTGHLLATRKQIPLILAWAVTIHKSQGQSIQKLVADVSDVFEAGQLYTALSRAVDPNNLQVIGFNSSKVKVDNISLNFCLENKLI